MQVSISEAKAKFSRLLDMVGQGKRVVITRRGIPTAEMVPVRSSKVRLGSLKGIVAPPPEEFFEDMGEDELREWEDK